MLYPRAWNDLEMDQIIGTILRGGVLLSALVVLAGGILYLMSFGSTQPIYKIFHGEPSELSTVSGIIGATWELRARGLIQFGLLLLIATPVVRVGFSVIGFALQRDWVYVMVTMIVLALLLFSLAGGGQQLHGI